MTVQGDCLIQWVFLIASERSGSNLLVRMLDAHPRFCGPSPVHAFRILAPRLPAYGPLDDDQAWRALTAHVMALWRTKIGVWKIQPSLKALRSVRPRTLAALLRTLYAAEASAQGKDVVVVKEIALHDFVAYLLAHFPEARFIHLVRDPRDVAASWKRSPTHRGAVVRAARRWRDEQAAAWRLQAWLGETGRFHQLRYEELLDRPEETLEALCRFLGSGFHPNMLEFHRHPLTRTLAGRADNWKNLSSPLLRANTGGYREVLSGEESRYVEGLCGGLMRRFGYRADSVPDADLAALEAHLTELEPHEKPQFLRLAPAERRRRAIWERTVRAIQTHVPKSSHDLAGAAA